MESRWEWERKIRLAEVKDELPECPCGCGQQSTHAGLSIGIVLVAGCELYVRRWVRDGIAACRITRHHIAPPKV